MGSLSGKAYDFKVDGICYNITGDSTVDVTFNTDYDYRGRVKIPNVVSDRDVTYMVTGIDNSAFYNCREVTSVAIPNSVTAIGEAAFANCELLATINIPNSVTTIGDFAFNSCENLRMMKIPNSVTMIGSHAFSLCSSMMSVTLPNSITRIEDFTFYGCVSLTSITIPYSVTSIGEHAFQRCDNLSLITILSPMPPSLFDGLCFSDDCYENTVLQVPVGTLQNYKSDLSWNRFLHAYGIGDVNSDDEISVADINELVTMILDVDNNRIGDVNNDNEINLADINALIDLILRCVQEPAHDE